jgi:hypothetical protein
VKDDDESHFWSKGVGWRDETAEFLWALFGGVLFLVLPFAACVFGWSLLR